MGVALGGVPDNGQKGRAGFLWLLAPLVHKLQDQKIQEDDFRPIINRTISKGCHPRGPFQQTQLTASIIALQYLSTDAYLFAEASVELSLLEMPSYHNREVRTSLGSIIPGQIAAIVRQHRHHPELGDKLSRIHAHSQRLKRHAPSPKKKRRVKRFEDRISSLQLTSTSCAQWGAPIIRGSIGVCTPGDITVTQCSGHAVSVCPDNASWVVIVFNISGRGMIPCLCPSYLLDEHAKMAIKKLNEGPYQIKQDKTRSKAHSLSFESIPAHRGNIQGHLLVTGPVNFRGRVVDDTLLKSLQMGCLRKVDHTNRSFYTLSRMYLVQKRVLEDVAHVIRPSSFGIRLCPAMRADISIMIRLGKAAIQKELVYYRTMPEAIAALENAANCPISTRELLLQVSMGGDPDRMLIGQFLPCIGKSNEPRRTTRCACGFVVDREHQSSCRFLLRRRCSEAS